MANNTTDGEKHLVANDGTDWRSTAGPVKASEAREIDLTDDEAAAAGNGPSATNEVTLARTTVDGSESKNG